MFIACDEFQSGRQSFISPSLSPYYYRRWGMFDKSTGTSPSALSVRHLVARRLSCLPVCRQCSTQKCPGSSYFNLSTHKPNLLYYIHPQQQQKQCSEGRKGTRQFHCFFFWLESGEIQIITYLEIYVLCIFIYIGWQMPPRILIATLKDDLFRKIIQNIWEKERTGMPPF